jgi:hypothetical protein
MPRVRNRLISWCSKPVEDFRSFRNFPLDREAQSDLR